MLLAACVVNSSDSILKQQDHTTKESVDLKEKQTKYLDLVSLEKELVFNQ